MHKDEFTPMLKTADVAAILAKTARWVSGAASAGQIGGAYRIGGEWRFDSVELWEWIEAQKCDPTPKPGSLRIKDATTRGRAMKKRLARLYGI